METENVLKDLQSLPPVASNVQKYYWEKVLPNTILPKSDLAPIEFVIEGRNDSFIDVKNIQKVVKVRVRKRNAAGNVVDLDQADAVVPYCGFLYTMFSDIHADLQHKPLYKSFDFYSILTYQQILYFVPNDAKKNLFTSALWFRDVQGGHSIIQDDMTLAPGEYRRKIAIATSRELEMRGKLMLDCFNTFRPIPDGMTLNLRFFPNESKNCLLFQANLQLLIEIMEMYLLVPRIIPKPTLLKQPARVPYVYTQVLRMLIPANQQNFGPRTVLITDILPRRCIVFLLTETQLHGQRDVSRIAFNHHNVNNVLLTVNGEHLPYYGGYKPDFANSQYGDLYEGLFMQLTKPNAVDLTREEFSGGFIVFPFDLTQKNLSSNFYPSKRSGAIELTLHFSQPTNANLSVLIMLEHERVINITRNRDWDDIPHV